MMYVFFADKLCRSNPRPADIAIALGGGGPQDCATVWQYCAAVLCTSVAALTALTCRRFSSTCRSRRICSSSCGRRDIYASGPILLFVTDLRRCSSRCVWGPGRPAHHVNAEELLLCDKCIVLNIENADSGGRKHLSYGD